MKKIFFVIFVFTLSSQNELITRLKFIIHYSLQPDGVNPYYFKLRIFYQSSIGNQETEESYQFLYFVYIIPTTAVHVGCTQIFQDSFLNFSW